MFKKKKYTVIRQAISKDLAAFVANLFYECKNKFMILVENARYFSPFENIIGQYEEADAQIPNTYSHYSTYCYGNFNVKMPT